MKKEPSTLKKAYAFGVLSIVLAPAPGIGLLLALIGLVYHAKARKVVAKNNRDYKLGKKGRAALSYCISGTLIGILVLTALFLWIYSEEVMSFIQAM